MSEVKKAVTQVDRSTKALGKAVGDISKVVNPTTGNMLFTIIIGIFSYCVSQLTPA